MNLSTQTRLISLALAAVVTAGMLGSLNAIATSGQSSDAVLAQTGSLQLACGNGASKS